MKVTLILIILCLPISGFQSLPQSSETEFLLMLPIQESFIRGDFSDFRFICEEKISVYINNPFEIRGFIYTDRFVQIFSPLFSEFTLAEEDLEWSSQWIEETFAIQSLNLSLTHRTSHRVYRFKFIFFMKREEINISRIDTSKNRIYFDKDPGWVVGSSFEVTGSANSDNNDWYRISEKKGSMVTVRKESGSMVPLTKDSAKGRAKAWKLYYLRGLNI